MAEDDDILVEEVRELKKSGAAARGTADIVGERRILSEPLTADEARRRMAALSRRNFLIGGAAAALGIFGWRWMSDETKAGLLRRAFEFNEWVSQAFYSPKRLSPEFDKTEITLSRVNGDLGMTTEIDAANWRLRVAGAGPDLDVTIDEIKALPRTDMIVEFKCIEGWSTITHFGGVRFSDFAARYAPENPHPYVSLTTPDEQYYVGWDLSSIMHPQTLLTYEMNGVPLTLEHGAPLRLASPTKYGIKQIKRIGRIEFTAERPPDFWGERGYDWYSGL